MDYVEKQDCLKVLQYVPKKLHSFWWRGYSDGDGSFYTGGNSIRQWSISGPYDSNWDALLDLLKGLGINNAKVNQYISNKGHKSSRVDVRGLESLTKLKTYLYGNFWDALGLERKYLKCEECLIQYGWGQRNGRKNKLV